MTETTKPTNLDSRQVVRIGDRSTFHNPLRTTDGYEINTDELANKLEATHDRKKLLEEETGRECHLVRTQMHHERDTVLELRAIGTQHANAFVEWKLKTPTRHARNMD